MSTRATITVADENDSFDIYQHHDGYPDGPNGLVRHIAMARRLAWDLPRFEAADFAAAVIAVLKDRGGSTYLTKDAEAHGDRSYHYRIEPARENTVTRAQLTISRPSWEGTRYGDCDMDAPTAAFVEIRDAWANRPGAADNLIKSIRSVYAWAIERGEISHNPAAGIAPINRNPKGGAKPWTPADLKAFKEAHPEGTTAYLWLTLQAFTACRIGDAIWLGRDQEVTHNGQTWLEWQPRKKGSAPVSIPILPPLFKATRSAKIVGPAYILNEKGKPFSSTEALRVRVQRWCNAAGLLGRSSHGVRKAVAELMAESGCSQHQIMAVMAHTEARTSEVYTKGVQRRLLAADGIQALGALDW